MSIDNYGYEAVEPFTAESQITKATVGDENDQGWRRLSLELKCDIDKSNTFNKRGSLRINPDRFDRPAGGNNDLEPGKRTNIAISKQQYTALQEATSIIRKKRDESGKVVTKDVDGKKFV